MNTILALLFASTIQIAEAKDLPQSGDVVQIGDFQFIIVDKSDYEKLTASVSYIKERLANANSTEDGRRMFHGKRGHTVVTNGVEQIEYEDGYVHETKVREQNIRPGAIREEKLNKKAGGKPLTPWEIRRNAILKKRKDALSVTNEVSVVIER